MVMPSLTGFGPQSSTACATSACESPSGSAIRATASQASSYEMAWSTSPLTPANFDAALAEHPVSPSDPQAAGVSEVKSFAAPQNHIYVGLRALDEAENPGRLVARTTE